MSSSKPLTLATKLSLWLPPILWLGTIFLFSSFRSLPTPQLFWWDFLLKKLAHLSEYAILFFLFHRALSFQRRLTWTQLFLLLAFCVFYATTDEWHQSLTPGRHPQISDVGFDTLGALLALLKTQALI